MLLYICENDVISLSSKGLEFRFFYYYLCSTEIILNFPKFDSVFEDILKTCWFVGWSSKNCVKCIHIYFLNVSHQPCSSSSSVCRSLSNGNSELLKYKRIRINIAVCAGHISLFSVQRGQSVSCVALLLLNLKIHQWKKCDRVFFPSFKYQSTQLFHLPLTCKRLYRLHSFLSHHFSNIYHINAQTLAPKLPKCGQRIRLNDVCQSNVDS